MAKELKARNLLNLLKRVYLGGVISEAVLNFNKGMIEAVDSTNSLFLHCIDDVLLKGFGEVGLGDLSLVCKYLESVGDEKLKVLKSDNRLEISSEGKGVLKYLLSDSEYVSSSVKGGELDQLIDPSTCTAELKEDFCKQLLLLVNLTKVRDIEFTAKDDMIVVCGGQESSHQFSLVLGQYKKIPKKKFQNVSVRIYAHHLSAIISNALVWNDKTYPVLYLAQDRPVIVKQDDNNLWALLPVEDDNSGE